MSTSFYLLCLLVLVQLIFSVLLYDLMIRKYRKLEDKLEDNWHKRMQRETIMAKIISLQRHRYNAISNHPEDKQHINAVDIEIQMLSNQLKITDNDEKTRNNTKQNKGDQR